MEAGIQHVQNQMEGKGQEQNIFLKNFFRITLEINLLTFIHLRLSLCIEYSTRLKYLTNAYPNNSFPSEAWSSWITVLFDPMWEIKANFLA